MNIQYKESASVIRISPVNPKNRTEILLLLKSLNIPKTIGNKYISVNSKFKAVLRLYIY